MLLSRWAVKTALVLNRSSTYHRSVPDAHLGELQYNGVPGDVAVFGTGYSPYRKEFDFLEFTQWNYPSNSTPLNENEADRSYKIGISIRGLLLLVIHYPSDQYAFGANPHRYVRLHTGHIEVFPHETIDETPPRSQSPEIEYLLRNIMIASKTWISLVRNVAEERARLMGLP